MLKDTYIIHVLVYIYTKNMNFITYYFFFYTILSFFFINISFSNAGHGHRAKRPVGEPGGGDR